MLVAFDEKDEMLGASHTILDSPDFRPLRLNILIHLLLSFHHLLLKRTCPGVGAVCRNI